MRVRVREGVGIKQRQRYTVHREGAGSHPEGVRSAKGVHGKAPKCITELEWRRSSCEEEEGVRPQSHRRARRTYPAEGPRRGGRELAHAGPAHRGAVAQGRRLVEDAQAVAACKIGALLVIARGERRAPALVGLLGGGSVAAMDGRAGEASGERVQLGARGVGQEICHCRL